MRASGLGLAMVMALAGSAAAADLRAPTLDPAPTDTGWSWTGCYGGAHIGGLWAAADQWSVRTPGGAFYSQSLGGHDLTGFIGGVQGGCDYQTAIGLVIGIKGDFSWADATGFHNSAREVGVSYQSEVKSLGSVTGRLGYARDRWLGYVEGGYAFERDDYSASTVVTGTAYVANQTWSGWMAGAGVEYAFTDRVSGFVDYSYRDYGSETIAFTPQIAGLPTGFLDIEATASVVRAGFNIRFGL
jgi:outer membrane immunogenic protein